MRILFINNRFPPYHVGGSGISCLRVAESLSKKHDVFILTSSYGLKKKTADANVFRLLHYLSINEKNLFLKRITQLKSAFLARDNYSITGKLIKKLKPDVVNIGQMDDLSLFPVLAVQESKVPFTFSLNNYWPMYARQYFLEGQKSFRWYIRTKLLGEDIFPKLKFNPMSAQTRVFKDEYVKAGFKPDTITVVGAGLNHEELNAGPKKDLSNKVRLLCCGRIVEEKGIDIAIEAVAYLVKVLKFSKVSLDIIGIGEPRYIRSLKDLVSSLSMEEFVHFKDIIPNEMMMRLYQDYDILLFPFRWVEPLGLTVIEAMAKGVIVIATNKGGPSELISDRQTGLLVSSEAPRDFALKIEELIKNPELVESIRSKALDLVRRNYTVDSFVPRIEAFFEKAIA
ncbi:MAG: glycosyltransferase [Candidatus Omnitrophica bacterium]|nr:glycosyltransferase [Candidatus Omnitrophota bacterium]